MRRAQTPIGGRARSRYASFDQWIFELGVLEAGDAVTYWLEVETCPVKCESAHFHFVTRRMRRLGGLADVRSAAQSVTATLLDEEGRPGPQLTLATTADQPAVIRCTIEQGHAPARPNTTGAALTLAAARLTADNRRAW